MSIQRWSGSALGRAAAHDNNGKSIRLVSLYSDLIGIERLATQKTTSNGGHGIIRANVSFSWGQ